VEQTSFKHLDAFIFLIGFLFVSVASNISLYVMEYGVLETVVLLFFKSLVVVYLPVQFLRLIVPKVRSRINHDA